MKPLAAVALAIAVVFSSSLARAGELPKTPEEFLKYFRFFTGEWKGTTKSGSKTLTETWVIEETPNKVCHLVIASVDGQPSGISLWGLDPKTKQWKGTYFGANGSHGTMTILDSPKGPEIKPGDIFTSTGKGTTLEGEPTTDSTKWIIVDKDTVRWEATNQRKGGEKVPDEVTVMKRQ